MCTLFYLFIYYIYVCLQNVNFLANKTLHVKKKTKKHVTSKDHPLKTTRINIIFLL